MNWKSYEEIVYHECKRIFTQSEVIANTHVVGVYSKRKRQIDIMIKNYQNMTVIVDAKNYNKKVDIKCVESFIGMIKDTGADKGIIVSEKGFTKSAINRAHIGENNIEVEIFSINTLYLFQSPVAIPHSGDNAIVINAPFGWIIDGTRREHLNATFYQRGLSFEEAYINKELAYLNFWDKEKSSTNVMDLIRMQNINLQEVDINATIKISKFESLWIREFKSKNYPSVEITFFRDFDSFIAFIVLFSPDNTVSRNIEKMKYLLSKAIPIKLEYKQ